jgi:hypothetical protein
MVMQVGRIGCQESGHIRVSHERVGRHKHGERCRVARQCNAELTGSGIGGRGVFYNEASVDAAADVVTEDIALDSKAYSTSEVGDWIVKQI